MFKEKPSCVEWWNTWPCEAPVPNRNEHTDCFSLLWVFVGRALKPIKWLMNELEFGTVAMASSDSTFSSLPVGAITIGVTLTLEQDGIPWQNHAVFPPFFQCSCFLFLERRHYSQDLARLTVVAWIEQSAQSQTRSALFTASPITFLVTDKTLSTSLLEFSSRFFPL